MRHYYLLCLLCLAVAFSQCKNKSPKKSKDTSGQTSGEVTPDPATDPAYKASIIEKMLDEMAKALINAAGGQGTVVRTVEGISVTLQPDFYFESSSADLSMTAEESLTRISTVLNAYPYTEIFIEGHADSSGNQEFNKQLSQMRAKSVAIFMRNNGVKANRMALAGYGATRPVASNETPEGRRLNRRVVLKIRVREEEFLDSLK